VTRSDGADDVLGTGGTVRGMFAVLEGTPLLVVLLIALVVFGGGQIPKLARNLGQAQKEFKKGFDQGHKDETAEGTSSST
jgi:sec-independent protein translocase protein TatA